MRRPRWSACAPVTSRRKPPSPSATLAPATLDVKQSYVFAEQQGLFTRVNSFLSGNPNSQQAVYELATKQIQGAAAKSELLADAVASGQEALGLLPPWNWWSVLPVAVVFALLWSGVEFLERSRWLARWKVPDESAFPERAAA